MTEVKLYKTPWKAIKIIALTIPFVIIGVWLAAKSDSDSKERIMGWFISCFFGLGIVVGLFNLFDKRPQIIINENGIWDRTTNQDIIKWEQIIEAYPVNISGQKFISLIVDDSFVFRTKEYKWTATVRELVEAQKLSLYLGQIKIDELKFTEFINKISQSEREIRSSIIKSYFN
jgi:hypothetical protein